MSMLYTSSYASQRAQTAKHALRWPVGAAVAALLCVSACGKDDAAPAPTGTAGTSAGVSGSTAGTSGSAGSTTPPPPQPVACGTATCNPPSSPLSGLLSAFGGGVSGLPTPVACCLDESSGKCGVAMAAGAACEASAVSDKRCPGIDASGLGALGGGASMVGCCIDNACGQDGALFGRGCVENSQAKSMISAIPLVGGLLTIPAARACDAPPPSTEDAGVEDAGI